MKNRMAGAVCALFSLLWIGPAYAQDYKTGAEIFPASTALYIEATNTPELIETILNHPLREKIEAVPQLEAFLKSPQMIPVMMGKQVIEKGLGDTIEGTLASITSGGLYFGLDSETEAIAILFRADEEAKLKKTAETVLNLVSSAGLQQGDRAPYKIESYRTAKVAKFDDFLMARLGKWFLVSSNADYAKKIADNLLDESGDRLASQGWFVEAMNSNQQQAVWAAMDLGLLRQSGAVEDLFVQQTDNPGIELVFGGVLDALQHAKHVSANLDFTKNLKFDFSLPFNESWASENRKYFYGEGLSGRAPQVIDVSDSIAYLTTYRDLGLWWLTKEDLFPESVIAGLAQFDSQVSTIFGGLDFGEEVLGSLEPGMQIVVARQEFGDYKPDVELPGFALVTKVKDIPGVKRRLSVAYQNAIGIFNLNAGMEGMPQLESLREKIDGVERTSAEYLLDPDTEDGLMLYNFTPSIAFKDQFMVISSTRELALELAKNVSEGTVDASNTLATVDGPQLQKILSANREALIANSMVEGGVSREEAEGNIDVALELAKYLKQASLDYQVQSKAMNFELNVEFTD